MINQNNNFKELLVNSFPRTGSTYLEYCISNKLNAPIFEHLHSPFLAKQNFDDVLQIVTIRDPKETITSNVYFDYGETLKQVNKDIDENFLNIQSNLHIDGYNIFYNNLLNNDGNILVLFFDDFTKDISNSLKTIAKIMKWDRYIEDNKKINDDIFTVINKNFSNNYPITRGHLPREKTKEYKQILNYLDNNSLILNNSYEIYLQIKSKHS
jgi:hypothetical protein